MTADPHQPFRSALTRALAATQTLPAPDADARTHSEVLSRLIQGEITAAGGHISFARFMQLTLYAPGLGYYSAGLHKFGAAGDFVTAPELGSLFARCLAQQCLPLLQELGEADLLEVGAGSGALATDLLLALESHGHLPRHYYILELSADLRQRQALQLQTRAPHLAARVRWLDTLPQQPWRGIVLANELLDAMPVERFRITAGGIQQLCVAWQGDEFVWRAVPADAALADTVRSRVDVASLPPGYTSEINLYAEAWLRSMAGLLSAGVILLIDYGYPRAEYYQAQRTDGTLLCHYRHRAHADPLTLVGLQDITSHVEFTALAEAGTDAGLTLLGYTSQAAFLLANGITHLAERSAGSDPRAQIDLAQEIKKLTLPQEMGELFKVMAFGRGLQTPMAGFALQDRRGRL
jgi:SAM-dependent MidA family methyltransferase